MNEIDRIEGADTGVLSRNGSEVPNLQKQTVTGQNEVLKG